jgi:hypothetical protein
MTDESEANLTGLSPEHVRMIAAAKEVNRFNVKYMFHARDPSDSEDRLWAEIDNLRSVKVGRGDDAALMARGFRTGECHRNCVAAAADGRGEHLFGWTVTREIYLSHSVLRLVDGLLVCITPEHTDELDAQGCFEFKIDPWITCDGVRTWRNGEELRQPSAVIRRDPVRVQARFSRLRDRIESGELSFARAERLLSDESLTSQT